MGEKNKILIIDDDPKLRKTLSDILKAKGYLPIDTATGREALERVNEEIPAITLIDLRLEDMTGLELMKEIKGRSSDIECIVLTGYASKASAIEAVNLGAYSYVEKPYDMEQLLLTIRRAIEKQEAEEALRDSEEKFRLIAETSPDYIYQVDMEGTIIYTSSAVEQVLGYKPQELIGKNFMKLVPPDALSDSMEKFQIALSQKRTGIFELPHVKKNGEVIYVETHARTMVKDGKSVGVQGITRDITERKQAEEALRRSEEKYRGIFDESVAAIYVFDEKKRFIDSNQAGLDLLGYSREELLDMSIPDVDADPVVALPAHENLFSGKRIINYEHQVKRKDGRIITVLNNSRPLTDGDGNTVGMQSTLIDITTAREAEKERRKMEAQLLEVQKMEAIATLAGGIAHEFNNALLGVTGNIELFEMAPPDNKNIRKHSEAIKASAQRMANLTRQLLAYAKGGKYDPKNISLSDFVEETLPIIMHTVDAAISVKTDFLGDINDVNVDLTQMQMVLSAILTNASEAIEGEGHIRISTSKVEIDEGFAKHHADLKPGPYICLTMEDDGKGMDKETKSGIFEPFYTTKFQGRGLGMASVYGIVKNHDGWISVYSEIGKGTVVRIYLPAVGVQIKEAAKPKIKPAKDRGTVLVVEDEEIVMDVSGAMLEHLGYHVLAAKTGKEALQIAKTLDVDIELAILDIALPDMDGRSVYPLLMKARPGMKVIVCSGYSIDGPGQKILDAGAQGFIQKPFTLAALSEKLDEVLEAK